MKRNEEINIAAKNKYPYIKGLPQTLSHQAIFIEGAEWADNTMLDYACEWLNKILYIHTEIEEDKDWCETNSTDWVTSDYETVEEFITEFRKAMEGGAE